MTLGEAKAKALKLMDEYSVNGVVTMDADIKNKLIPFFDTAQKNLCQIKKIVREYKVPVEPTDATEARYPMPDDFLSLRLVRVNGTVKQAGRWLGDVLILPGNETREVTVEYNAFPKTLPDNAPDETQFEISQDAQECMPYWVASQIMISDFIQDYRPLMEIYQQMLAVLSTAQPGSIAFVKVGMG